MLSKSIQLSKQLTISPQPTKSELDKLAKSGFKSVVNLCTKKELGQTMTPEEEGKFVQELGMEYMHFPISIARLKLNQTAEFFESFNSLPKPVYIHCRIGQRCVLFGLIIYARKRGLNFDATIDLSEKLGIALEIPSMRSFIKQCLGESEAKAA